MTKRLVLQLLLAVTQFAVPSSAPLAGGSSRTSDRLVELEVEACEAADSAALEGLTTEGLSEGALRNLLREWPGVVIQGRELRSRDIQSSQGSYIADTDWAPSDSAALLFRPMRSPACSVYQPGSRHVFHLPVALVPTCDVTPPDDLYCVLREGTAAVQLKQELFPLLPSDHLNAIERLNRPVLLTCTPEREPDAPPDLRPFVGTRNVVTPVHRAELKPSASPGKLRLSVVSHGNTCLDPSLVCFRGQCLAEYSRSPSSMPSEVRIDFGAPTRSRRELESVADMFNQQSDASESHVFAE